MEIMNTVIEAIIGGVIWDNIKKGTLNIKIIKDNLKDTIKSKLSENSYSTIADIINKAPSESKTSENLLKDYLQNNQEFINIFNDNHKSSEINNFHDNSQYSKQIYSNNAQNNSQIFEIRGDVHELNVGNDGNNENNEKKTKIGKINTPEKSNFNKNELISINGNVENIPDDYYVWMILKKGSLYWPKKFIEVKNSDWDFSFREGSYGTFKMNLCLVKEKGHHQIEKWLDDGEINNDFLGISRINTLEILDYIKLNIEKKN